MIYIVATNKERAQHLARLFKLGKRDFRHVAQATDLVALSGDVSIWLVEGWLDRRDCAEMLAYVSSAMLKGARVQTISDRL